MDIIQFPYYSPVHDSSLMSTENYFGRESLSAVHHYNTGCPIPDVDNLRLLCTDFYVWDAVTIFNHLHRMFLSTDYAFRITDWTCFHGPHLHAILRIISRGVSGLATDSPCGVWGRGWTTCLLHDISYIYYFLPLFTVSCMKPVIFLLSNNLFIYQVPCTLISRRRSLYSFLWATLLQMEIDTLKLWCVYNVINLLEICKDTPAGMVKLISLYSTGVMIFSANNIPWITSVFLWAPYQIRTIAGNACAGNAENVSLPPTSKKTAS